ncbi:hypothetical protein TTRE_0000475701 [Trichuris trichiura]|uniref:Vacuolar ATPase assembly protein VMA22 n=1 Tax=Trichuris trichiura TaxID=36087 RepID=A0A077Z7K0_TRITR|nr:hypothetical protein TTRE_0000475701 [Trichuris trichiura]
MDSTTQCYNHEADAFILDYLEMLDDYVRKKFELERRLKECWYQLARARVCLGSTSKVSKLQFDFRDQPSILTLEVSEDGDVFKLMFSVPMATVERETLKRFGILVPKSLKTAQSAVAPAIQLVCEIAALQKKINALMSKFEPSK